MRNMLLLLLLCFTLQSQANTPETKVTSEIKSATVFLSGAQVNRTATASIPSGESIIRLTGLTPNLDPNSIQVNGEGNFTILGVQHESNHDKGPDVSEEVQLLDQQIEDFNLKIGDENVLLTVLQEEEKFLLANHAIGGANTGIPISELKAGAAFIRERALSIKQERLTVKRKIAGLKKEQDKLKTKRKAIKTVKAKHTMEIVLTCSAKSKVPAKFKISYIVKSAGWFPNYDIRVKDVASDVQLDYRASVYQSTGENWEKINLTLSTGNPFESGTRPNLEPWYLNFTNNYYKKRRQDYGAYNSSVRRISGVITDENGEALIGANVLVKGFSNGTTTDFDGRYVLDIPPNARAIQVSYTGFGMTERVISGSQMNVSLSEGVSLDEVVVTGGSRPKSRKESNAVYDYAEDAETLVPTETVEKTTTVNFVIDIPYSITADGKRKIVQIKAYDLPAAYEYFAIPKLDADAFLTANVTGWEQYDLLSGEANLFFEGTYLGKSYLDVDAVEDTLALSLGRDKNIVIERTRKKDFTKKQFIGANRVDSRAWKIEVRNKKKQTIHLILEDQFPLSTNDEIEVKEGKYEGANLDKETGKLTWEFDLAPNVNKTMEFDYEVKYPKKKRLSLE